MAEEWEPASLGDERLDGEHRQVIRRLRVLAAAVSASKVDEVRATVKILSVSLTEHWRHEEQWMEEAGYPGVAEHKRHHDALLLRLADAVKPVALAGLPRAALELAQAVEEHVRVEDLKLARFFAARANFKAMAEARPGKGPALTPLPGQLPTLDLGGRTPLPVRTPAPARTPEPARPPLAASAPARTPEPGRFTIVTPPPDRKR